MRAAGARDGPGQPHPRLLAAKTAGILIKGCLAKEPCYVSHLGHRPHSGSRCAGRLGTPVPTSSGSLWVRAGARTWQSRRSGRGPTALGRKPQHPLPEPCLPEGAGRFGGPCQGGGDPSLEGRWFSQDSWARARGAEQTQGWHCTLPWGRGRVPRRWRAALILAASFRLGWDRGQAVGHLGSELAGHSVPG